MTAYSNFIQDFPTRCLEILDKGFEEAKANNREVTLMLSIAATSFIFPFERLRPISSQHPAADREKFKRAKKRFNQIIETKFLNSELWNEGVYWEFVKEIAAKEIRENQADHWARAEIRQPLLEERSINSVISHLRNAFSHGSVFTYPNYTEQGKPLEIETLIFLSRLCEKQIVANCKKCGEPIKDRVQVDKFNLLAVSPEDFYKFLKKWIKFLESLSLE